MASEDNAPLAAQMLQLRDELARLRDKQDRPWYREPSLVVSALALILSVVSWTLSMIGDREKNFHERTQLLHETLGKIQLLQRAVEEHVSEAFNSDQPVITDELADVALNIIAYVESARQLAEELDEHISYADHFVLAKCAGDHLGFEAADYQCRRAREKVQRQKGQLNTLQAEAQIVNTHGDLHFLYAGVSPTASRERGRELYQESIQLLLRSDTQERRLQVASFGIGWAAAELRAEEYARARQVVERAIPYVQPFPPQVRKLITATYNAQAESESRKASYNSAKAPVYVIEDHEGKLRLAARKASKINVLNAQALPAQNR